MNKKQFPFIARDKFPYPVNVAVNNTYNFRGEITSKLKNQPYIQDESKSLSGFPGLINGYRDNILESFYIFM